MSSRANLEGTSLIEAEEHEVGTLTTPQPTAVSPRQGPRGVRYSVFGWENEVGTLTALGILLTVSPRQDPTGVRYSVFGWGNEAGTLTALEILLTVSSRQGPTGVRYSVFG